MPYTLKTNQISVKDPVTGEYSGVDVFTEQTEQGLIAELQATGTAQVNRINQAAVDVQAAVDQAESDAAEIISGTQSAINTLESEKNSIAATVASMAELGTDTTLTTPGMAADAKTTGDAIGDLNNSLTNVSDALPYNQSSGAFVKIGGTKSGSFIKMSFQAEESNRVYCGGTNLFDGTIRHIAISDKVLESDNYRGFSCPIKGGRVYTICRSKVSSSRFYIGVTETYPVKNVPLIGSLRDGGSKLTYTFNNIPSNAKYIVVYLSNSGEDVSTTDFWVVEGSAGGAFEPYDGTIITTNSNSASGVAVDGTTCCWCDSGDIQVENSKTVPEYFGNLVASPSPSNTGNFSIVCAKEHTYLDGTAPCIEYFLIEECGTNKFYFTKDFAVKTPAFVFHGNPLNYAFGILNNGDVIACALADSLESGKDDSHRVNPYCWLASEHWAIQHEVDFGESLKPCGWLSSCGFRVLGDGTAMFVEYTRMTVATANVWKITGTPTNKSNWTIVKSFEVTTTDNNTGFKHIHMVVQDFYNGTIYISTGDDNENSKIFYSADNGTTWSQLGTPSQKYCRNLMMIFTSDYIYWAADSSGDELRYLFRATRDGNGILDFSSIEDYIHFGGENAIAAYGLSYIPELSAMLILDRADGAKTSIPLKIVDIANETYQQIATLYATNPPDLVGFRTRYSEWYPKDGFIRFGFGFKTVADFNNVNHIKGFDNQGLSNTGSGIYNINNLVAKIYKNGSSFGVQFNTLY